MKPNIIVAAAVLLSIALPGFCGGGSEAESSARGEYLASRGIIIPPKDVYPESYIAQIDYDYPDPNDDLTCGCWSFLGIDVQPPVRFF